MGIKKISEILIKEKVKNELILLLTGSLDPENYIGLELLAKHNDVIIIHLLHPYEMHPENYDSVLIESKTPKISRYKVELRNTLQNIKKELSNHDITHILASTEDNPAELLNFFFKHRYAR